MREEGGSEEKEKEKETHKEGGVKRGCQVRMQKETVEIKRERREGKKRRKRDAKGNMGKKKRWC